jgi:hypothetical protein
MRLQHVTNVRVPLLLLLVLYEPEVTAVSQACCAVSVSPAVPAVCDSKSWLLLLSLPLFEFVNVGHSRLD